MGLSPLRRALPATVAVLALAASASPAGSRDEARIGLEDAHRFAAAFVAGDGLPTARALDAGYLRPATPALAAFVPEYIVDAATLAQAVADAPGPYRHAVDACLPMMARMGGFVQAVQLRYQELLPDAAPAAVVALFSTGNVAGTVVDGRIVLGLEKVCGGVSSEDGLRARLRGLVAHEWVHTRQPPPSDADRRDLLAWALREGTANTLAALVLGEATRASDNAWAMQREGELWTQFQRDRATMRAHWPDGGEPDAEAIEAGTRWLWNSAAPDGRPADLGYWVGQRITQAWLSRQPDKAEAVRRMLAMASVDAFLAESGYAP